MINKNGIYYIIRILTLSLIIILLAGCNANPKRPNPNDKKNRLPDLPKVIEEMEEQLLKIMYDLDAIPGMENAIAEKEKAKAEIEAETEKELKKQEKDSQAKAAVDVKSEIEKTQRVIPLLKEDEIKGSSVKENEPPEEINAIWMDIQAEVNDLHKKWNVLEPQLQKAKVSKPPLTDFEKQLDQITMEIHNQKIIESMLALNRLTEYLASYRSYFHTKTPHDIYLLNYHIRNSVLLASEDNFEDGLMHMEKSEEIANDLRPQLVEKGADDVAQKLDLSIEDMKREIENQNFALTLIKAPIVIKNTRLADEAFRGNIK